MTHSDEMELIEVSFGKPQSSDLAAYFIKALSQIEQLTRKYDMLRTDPLKELRSEHGIGTDGTD